MAPTETDQGQFVSLEERGIELPDWLTELQDRTQLTRKKIVRILIDGARLNDFKRNPQQFIGLVQGAGAARDLRLPIGPCWCSGTAKRSRTRGRDQRKAVRRCAARHRKREDRLRARAFRELVHDARRGSVRFVRAISVDDFSKHWQQD